MTKLLNALKRTFGEGRYQEERPHFHQGTTDVAPEVCYEALCPRPHLSV